MSEELSSLVTSQAVQLERLSKIDKKLDICIMGIYGTPDKPSTGLNVRVDRLEQTRKGLLIGFWTICTGVIGLTLHAVATLFGWKT